MSPMSTSPDGRILFAMETAGEGDGNSVVYYDGIPVWDRFSFERAHPELVKAPPATDPSPSDPPPLPRPPTGRPRLLRVTDEQDGRIPPRMYSYYSNAWVTENDSAIVFCGHEDGLPRFYRVTLSNGNVSRLGSLSVPYAGETEGWYWDQEGWLYLIDGPRLRRINPILNHDRVVFDISDSAPGCDLWQAHSSSDGLTHSATVRRIVPEGRYPYISTVVCRNGGQLSYFPARGVLDESQVTSDGLYLIIKEDDDNRIIQLRTRDTRFLRNADGAVGHSDVGNSIVVGEDDIHGECVLWDLQGTLLPEYRRTLFQTWGMGHLSLKGGRCLLSDATHLSLVALDGSGVTPLIAHGMVGSDYDHQVQGNLDPTGRVACFMSNFGSDRQDVYLVVL